MHSQAVFSSKVIIYDYGIMGLWDKRIMVTTQVVLFIAKLSPLVKSSFRIMRLWDYWIMGLWDYGITGLWDYGIFGLWDYGIMGLWDYEIMRLLN